MIENSSEEDRSLGGDNSRGFEGMFEEMVIIPATETPVTPEAKPPLDDTITVSSKRAAKNIGQAMLSEEKLDPAPKRGSKKGTPPKTIRRRHQNGFRSFNY